MKVLFDHQIFSIQKYGGISRYFVQIISNLPRSIDWELAVKYTDNMYIRQLNLSREIKEMYDPYDVFMPGINFRGKGRLFNLLKKIDKRKGYDCYSLNREFSIELLKKGDFDIFHPTYYDDYFLEFLGDKPFVLTIHDMIHELYPEMLFDLLTLKRKAELAYKADHIIAVSENTKKDIIEIFGIPEGRISVVYHANILNPNNILDHPLPERFLLYVGERSYYKNFLFFITAISQILIDDPDLKLICTGRPFSSFENDFCDRLGILEQIILKPADDRELAFLYSKALALIFPSYSEGFGIPILEAFAMSCPVVLSDIKCFREIAADAALFFDPKSVINIKNVVKEIIYNNETRKKLIDRGHKRTSLFSWAESALSTANIYFKIGINS